jgi:hypothetical protein
MFNRRQAQEWRKYYTTLQIYSQSSNGLISVYYQDQVAQRVKSAVLEVGRSSGHILTRRPFQSLWYTSQVSICLALWNYDRTLIQALELAKTFLIPVETLDALWPCPSEFFISPRLSWPRC